MFHPSSSGVARASANPEDQNEDANEHNLRKNCRNVETLRKFSHLAHLHPRKRERGFDYDPA